MTGVHSAPREIKRRKFHRCVFVAAGIYNIVWGVWTGLDPQLFFRFAGLEPLNHPAIWSCLAMVIGLYGVIYLEVARVPECGWVLAAVALVGKIVGPIALTVLVVQGQWPTKALWMCLTNDFIWWVPFGLYLWDAWPAFRASLSRRA